MRICTCLQTQANGGRWNRKKWRSVHTCSNHSVRLASSTTMRRYKTSFTFINFESHVYSFQGFGGKRFLLIAQEKSATCKSDFITNPKLLIPPILFLQIKCKDIESKASCHNLWLEYTNQVQRKKNWPSSIFCWMFLEQNNLGSTVSKFPKVYRMTKQQNRRTATFFENAVKGLMSSSYIFLYLFSTSAPVPDSKSSRCCTANSSWIGLW